MRPIKHPPTDTVICNGGYRGGDDREHERTRSHSGETETSRFASGGRPVGELIPSTQGGQQCKAGPLPRLVGFELGETVKHRFEAVVFPVANRLAPDIILDHASICELREMDMLELDLQLGAVRLLTASTGVLREQMPDRFLKGNGIVGRRLEVSEEVPAVMVCQQIQYRIQGEWVGVERRVGRRFRVSIIVILALCASHDVAPQGVVLPLMNS